MAAAEDVRYGLALAGVDPASLTRALGTALAEAARRPHVVAEAFARLTRAQLALAFDTGRMALGATGAPPATPDRRFQDRAWSENPLLCFVLGSYLASARTAHEVIEEIELDEETRRKAAFALGLLLDAAAPSNLPWVNPTVVKEAYDTGGRSVVRGARLFLEDLARNGGRPSQVDTEAFELGRNLAATPGRVVFRNELLELLAYEPATERVHARPILYIPPWINRYYVLDLSPSRSFVEYAVAQGFTVLAISYRNPDETMAKLTLDDYLREGFLTALERTSELTGAETVNVVSVCVGGTLTAIGLAVLAARGEAERVGCAALLNTLVDFAEPGEISAFTDEAAIKRIERRVQRRGYMDPAEISEPFTLMKGNDLIWRYVVSNWLMGQDPPAFDILAWNADSTQLPANMHSFYLRSLYMKNLLAKGELEIAGQTLSLAEVKSDAYIVGAVNDHIVPWQGSYQATHLLAGEVRYVLTSGGHIAGIVNPPNPKAWYEVAEENPATPQAWQELATRHSGSWWEDWEQWGAERAGPLGPPPPVGSDRYPALGDAPGEYVLG